MGTTMKKLLILFSAGALAIPIARAQEQYTLQYRLAKGHVYRFADSTLVKSSQEMMGQEIKTTSTILATTRLEPTEIRDDGSTVLTVSAEAIRVAVKNPRMDTTMVVKEMIGKRTRLTISRLGETLGREIIDTVRLTGMAATTGRQDMVRLHVFSPKPIKIGETWSATKPDSFEMGGGGKMVTVSKGDFTLLAKEAMLGRECLKVSFKGTVTVSGKGSMGGAEFFLEGNGTTGGTFFVDASTGIPVREDSQFSVETTVALTGPQNMTIPGSQLATTHRVLLSD